ncbi:hypothetical protein FB451DRAFT_1565115 [Mycena latifolia]|nr:hypothetical protein FB451DRAFT_1565115 [Mycena latifolia]
MSTDNLELGTLVIVVLKAKNLNDKYFWKQDVFAQVGLNGDTKRTKVDVKGGQHPMWDEEIRVPVMKATGDKFRKLEVSCWAKEPKKEENIGQGFVDLTETLKTGEFDDWVSLETNGVTRGEVYLEMTFFTNAPAPAGLLAAKANNLQRRPSKLSPAERLARPAYTPSTSSEGHPHRRQDHHNGLLSPSPPSSRTASASPSRQGRESPLPPLPEQLGTGPPVPNTLTPGRPRPQGAQGLTQHVPSVLRPRNPKSSPTPIPHPDSDYSGVVHGYNPDSPPRTYTPVVPPPDSTYDDDASSYARPPLERWGSGSNDSPADFSFPVPSIPGAREPTVEFSSPPPPAGYGAGPAPGRERHSSTASFQAPPPPSFTPHPPQFQQQQPLFQPQQPPQFQPPPPQFQPSPPQFQSPPSAQFQPPPQQFQQPPPSFQQPPPTFQQPPPTFHQPPPTFQSPPPSFTPPVAPHGPAHRNEDLPDPYLLARYQSPLPLPPGAGSSPRGRQTEAAPKSQPAAPAPAPAPPSKPQSKPTPASQSNPDNARLQALRQVEAEAARRRAQEEKDRELARQLDRELNLGETAGAGAGMPGSW